NTGNSNTGSDNSGDNNTGNSNVGSDNSGDNNTGNSNAGSDNSGDNNTGNSNTGTDNSGDNNVGDNNKGSNNNGSGNVGDNNNGNNLIGNNLSNPELSVKNSTVTAGTWQPGDNFVGLTDHYGNYVTVNGITFVDRTAYGYFSDDISENVIQYVLSGDINVPGQYTVKYMWGSLSLTNSDLASLMEMMNLNDSGVLGDKTWATADITVLSAPDNGSESTSNSGVESGNSTSAGKNASGRSNLMDANGAEALPKTGYSSEGMLSLAGLTLLGLVGLSASRKKEI
ncbi:LPXTG cell wall anchor domain-containing protein, partial [Weissella muntiaci]